MTQKEIILEQMTACFDQKSWLVPLSDALSGLTAIQASWHDESSNHSVWQIVNHLIFWNKRYVERFMGITIPGFEGENSSTFSDGKINDEDWEKDLSELLNILRSFKRLIEYSDEQKLQSSPYKNSTDSWYSILSHVNIHNAYHIGQIVTLRKQQGSWNPEAGVK
jgi:uncharacterized damage-inducible protein DinB